MVEVRNLRKRFGAVAAVDGVSFTAPNGQITGLLGENGAGKTTTLGMIGGVVRPDAGSILIDGVDAKVSRDGRRHLGALLDHKSLYSRLTARENIRYSASSTVCRRRPSTSACRAHWRCWGWTASPTAAPGFSRKASA